MRLVNTLVDRVLERIRFAPPPTPPWDPLYARPIAELMRLAEDGDGAAAYVVGDIFDQGYDGMPCDRRRALHWYRLAEETDQPDALNNIGSMYQHGHELPRSLDMARRYYERAAALGCGTAMNNLGRFYLTGQGGVRRDPAAGLAWLRKGAARGDTDAMLGLAHAYGTGTQVRRSPLLRFLYWNRRAAACDDGRAVYNLAVQYDDGETVLPDAGRAVRLYERAACLGSASAAYWLARKHLDGRGVAADPRQAYRRFRQAEELGHESAGEWADDLLETHPELRDG